MERSQIHAQTGKDGNRVDYWDILHLPLYLADVTLIMSMVRFKILKITFFRLAFIC